MPAQSITSTPTKVACCDVVGKYTAGLDGFVRHVGLAEDASESVVKGDVLAVAEMEPPLHAGKSWVPDVCGTAMLTRDEIKQVQLFCRQHRDKHARYILDCERGFIIHPHCKPFYEEDGTPVATRFSCVGFVIEAYREIKIDLIVTGADKLGKVSWETLALAYPEINKGWWAKINQEYDLGLDPASPEWRIVLPGYVLHALARDSKDIRDTPYLPQEQDAYFPH